MSGDSTYGWSGMILFVGAVHFGGQISPIDETVLAGRPIARWVLLADPDHLPYWYSHAE